MKNIKYILSFFAIAALLFSSCDEAELYPKFGAEPGQSTVAFVSGTSNVQESTAISYADGTSDLSGQVSSVSLVRRSADISSALVVSVSFTATYVSDNEFVSVGEDATDAIKIMDNLSEVTFAANSATTSFQIATVNDVLPAGDVEVIFEITSVSEEKYQIGLGEPGGVNSTTTLTIIDDDCPIDIPGVWEGVYEVVTFEGAPGSFNEGFAPGAAPGRRVLVELDPTDPLGATAILKPAATNPLLVDEMPLAFAACPETVLIGDGSYALAFNQNGAPASIGRSDEPETYGNGTFKADGSGFSIVVGYGNVNLGLVFDEFLVVFERVED